MKHEDFLSELDRLDHNKYSMFKNILFNSDWEMRGVLFTVFTSFFRLYSPESMRSNIGKKRIIQLRDILLNPDRRDELKSMLDDPYLILLYWAIFILRIDESLSENWSDILSDPKKADMVRLIIKNADMLGQFDQILESKGLITEAYSVALSTLYEMQGKNERLAEADPKVLKTIEEFITSVMSRM